MVPIDRSGGIDKACTFDRKIFFPLATFPPHDSVGKAWGFLRKCTILSSVVQNTIYPISASWMYPTHTAALFWRDYLPRVYCLMMLPYR